MTLGPLSPPIYSILRFRKFLAWKGLHFAHQETEPGKGDASQHKRLSHIPWLGPVLGIELNEICLCLRVYQAWT